jgi:hypothetical protein
MNKIFFSLSFLGVSYTTDENLAHENASRVELRILSFEKFFLYKSSCQRSIETENGDKHQLPLSVPQEKFDEQVKDQITTLKASLAHTINANTNRTKLATVGRKTL